MRPVDFQWTFGQLLSREDHIMPGCPVVWVLCRGSDFHRTFLERFDASRV